MEVKYTDEDREIHEIFERELAAKGVTCNMKAFIPYCTGEAGVLSERGTLPSWARLARSLPLSDSHANCFSEGRESPAL